MITTINGHAVGYDDQGEGLAVLFVHGFPHDRTLWTAQQRALASAARTITPDLRGFGESGTDGPYSMDQYADDLAALLDALEIEQAAVCGLSMGGYIAMALWRRHPDRVRALAFCATKATPDTVEARAGRAAAMDAVQTLGMEVFAEQQLDRMLGRTTHAERPDVVAAMRTMMARQRAGGVVGTLEALRDRPDSRETLGSITVPTLLLVGDEDVITPLSDAEAMLACLPAASTPRLDIISGSGHCLCVERPAAVTFALHDFLAPLIYERA